MTRTGKKKNRRQKAGPRSGKVTVLVEGYWMKTIAVRLGSMSYDAYRERRSYFKDRYSNYRGTIFHEAVSAT